jgi:hypothetical protein
MRLWTIHPKHLDAKGLVVLWREALLAQKVLQGRTRGYRHHPQLFRFQALRNPAAALASYLAVVHEESVRRGYHFDRKKSGSNDFAGASPRQKASYFTNGNISRPNWRCATRHAIVPASPLPCPNITHCSGSSREPCGIGRNSRSFYFKISRGAIQHPL